MASKRKWSGAESRKSMRELLRSAEAIESITTFARTACSAVSTSEGSLVLCYLTVTGLIAFLYT